MDAKKLKRLRAAGWQSGTAQEFLKLSNDEAALVGQLKLDAAKGSRKDFDKFLYEVSSVPALPEDERSHPQTENESAYCKFTIEFGGHQDHSTEPISPRSNIS